MSSGCLIAFRADRLGARLISMVNALRVGELCDLPVKVHWMTTDGVGSEFNDPYELFEASFVDTHFIDTDNWRQIKTDCLKIQDFAAKPPDILSARVRGGSNVTVSMAFGVFAFGTEDDTAVRTEAGRVFHSLPLADPLAHLKEPVAQVLKDAVAYHIRRGDLIADIKAMNRAWPHKYVPEAFYMAHIRDTLQSGRKVVVFSDETRTKNLFKEAFPELLTLDMLIDTEGLPRGAQDYLELFAMSCCTQIIAPEASAFSSTAAQLGGVPLSDVKTDLRKTTYESCCTELLEQFKEKPDTLGDIGEQGQILLHLDRYLISEGRLTEARELYVRKTRDEKMPVSYLYPRTLELMLETEAMKDAVAFGRAIPTYPIYHKGDQMKSLFLHATAEAEAGNTAAALEAVHLLVWSYADSGLLRRLPRLILADVLTQENFFPVSKDIMFLGGRNLDRFASDFERRFFAALERDAGQVEPDRSRALLEPLLWDWAPLIGNPAAAARPMDKVGGKLVQKLSQMPHVDSSVAVRSTLALVQALTGAIEPALEKLEDLARGRDADAPVLMRLSRVRLLARDRQGAIDAAARACELSDAPAYQLWHATCLKYGDHAQAEKGLELLIGLAATLWTASPYYWTLKGELASKLGDIASSLNSAETAWNLAPHNARLATLYSNNLRENGQSAQSARILDDLFEAQRLPNGAAPHLIRYLLDENKTDRAQEVYSAIARQKPASRLELMEAFPDLRPE